MRSFRAFRSFLRSSESSLLLIAVRAVRQVVRVAGEPEYARLAGLSGLAVLARLADPERRVRGLVDRERVLREVEGVPDHALLDPDARRGPLVLKDEGERAVQVEV